MDQISRAYLHEALRPADAGANLFGDGGADFWADLWHLFS